MIKKLEKILNYIDETKTESLIDVMKWCIDNDCWVPTYHAIISGYLNNNIESNIDEKFNEELVDMKISQDEKKRSNNALRILNYIESIKEPNYREFIKWLNRSNLIKEYVMALQIFNECYLEHVNQMYEE